MTTCNVNKCLTTHTHTHLLDLYLLSKHLNALAKINRKTFKHSDTYNHNGTKSSQLGVSITYIGLYFCKHTSGLIGVEMLFYVKKDENREHICHLSCYLNARLKAVVKTSFQQCIWFVSKQRGQWHPLFIWIQFGQVKLKQKTRLWHVIKDVSCGLSQKKGKRKNVLLK